MSKSTKVDELYCEIMELWLDEQAERILDFQRAATSARKIAELNDKQLALHRQTLKVGVDQHKAWLKQQSKKK